MSAPQLRILSVTPVHPGAGQPSRVEANVELGHLRTKPVVAVVLTPEQALDLSQQALQAARTVVRSNLHRQDLEAMRATAEAYAELAGLQLVKRKARP